MPTEPAMHSQTTPHMNCLAITEVDNAMEANVDIEVLDSTLAHLVRMTSRH